MRIVFLFAILLFTSVKAEAEIHPLFTAAEKQFNEKNYEGALINFNLLIQQMPEKKEGYFNA